MTSQPEPSDQSVLSSMKKLLLVGDEDDTFNTDLTIAINTAFGTLHQLGIGPVEGYRITSKENVWGEFTDNDPVLEQVKSYVYLRCRMLFDIPDTSYKITAAKDQIKELEWRLNTYREGKVWAARKTS